MRDRVDSYLKGYMTIHVRPSPQLLIKHKHSIKEDNDLNPFMNKKLRLTDSRKKNREKNTKEMDVVLNSKNKMQRNQVTPLVRNLNFLSLGSLHQRKHSGKIIYPEGITPVIFQEMHPKNEYNERPKAYNYLTIAEKAKIRSESLKSTSSGFLKNSLNSSPNQKIYIQTGTTFVEKKRSLSSFENRKDLYETKYRTTFKQKKTLQLD